MNTIQLLWEKIASSQNILLINHIRMDPDAYWSLTGFYQILEALWKNVQAINDLNAPDSFSFMWMNHVFSSTIPTNFSPDLIISFDASSLDQLWDVYENNKDIFNTTDFFVIDHHITNPGFWKHNIIKTDYSSTCEITLELIEELSYDIHMTAKIASCLFSGIITDTNVFYNKNTTANTHKVAARLIEHWADFRAPIYEFYKKKSLSQIKLWWILVKNMNQIKVWKHNITYTTLSTSDTTNIDISSSDLSSFTKDFVWNHLANIEWSDICFIISSLDEKIVKASFRSREYDVSKLCQSFGWWWHMLAAGCNYEWSIEDFRDEIIKRLSL